MRKGITPIIAIIILLLITIALAGAAWSYLQGFLLSQIAKSFVIPSGGAYCTNGVIKVYVLNTGHDSVLTENDFILAEVDGNDATTGLQSATIDQGQAKLIFEWDCKGPDGIADTSDDVCNSPVRGYHQVRLGTSSTIVDPRVSCT